MTEQQIQRVLTTGDIVRLGEAVVLDEQGKAIGFRHEVVEAMIRAKVAEALAAQVPDISARVRELADEAEAQAESCAVSINGSEFVALPHVKGVLLTLTRVLLDRPNGGE